MFALEIMFNDGVSKPEVVLVRRPQAILGYTDYAHVVIEDLRELGCQFRLVRDIGKKFRCKPIGDETKTIELSSLLEAVYDGEADINLGKVRLHISALDFDLTLKEGEPPDRAGVRVLRQAASHPSPQFPALLIDGPTSMAISFVSDQPLLIGRSKQCTVRLDSNDISAKHARIGFEAGDFWVEDLGSTNGTFVNMQQVSGKVSVSPGTQMVLGREVTIIGVVSDEQIDRASTLAPKAIKESETIRKYPALVSLSDLARPARVILSPGTKINIGRDPTSELWIGAPHVSRRHLVVSMSPSGALMVENLGSNEARVNAQTFKRGELIPLEERPYVFDLDRGLTVGLCFSPEDEERFIATNGSALAFINVPGQDVAADAGAIGKIKKQTKGSSLIMFLADSLKGVLELYKNGPSHVKLLILLVLVVSSLCLILLVLLLLQY